VTANRLEPAELERIANQTLASYQARAKDFWEGTRDHDVSQNVAALLGNLRGEPPFAILDIGCGPGRDLKTFADLGHNAVGLEGVAEFATHARSFSGCEVWEQDLLQMELPPGRFDGIFANAVLFHVPTQELARVLGQLRAALKPGGVFFASNPHGNNEEGWRRGRYGAFLDHPTWSGYASAAGFTEIDHYYRPAGVPRAEQPWLATVYRAVQGVSRPGARVADPAG
jgi:SAM-dependent methyltransferase